MTNPQKAGDNGMEWVLVPKVPTPEMEAAARTGVRPFHDIPEKDWNMSMPKDFFRISYRAMLAAVPPPPSPAGNDLVEGFDATARGDQIAMAAATIDGENWVRLSDFEQMRQERDANGLEAHQLRTDRDSQQRQAIKWLGLHDQQEARAETAEARISSLSSELEKAREALKPFAEAAENLEDGHRDNSPIWETPAAMGIDAKHLHAAVAALKENSNGK